MEVIEKLKFHNENELEEWLEYGSKKSKALSKEVVVLADISYSCPFNL